MLTVNQNQTIHPFSIPYIHTWLYSGPRFYRGPFWQCDTILHRGKSSRTTDQSKRIYPKFGSSWLTGSCFQRSCYMRGGDRRRLDTWRDSLSHDRLYNFAYFRRLVDDKYKSLSCNRSLEFVWKHLHEKKMCALRVHNMVNNNRAVIAAIFGWAKFDYDPAQSYCFAEWMSSKSYTIFMISVRFLVPLSVMSYCYYNIIRLHRESERRVMAETIMSRDGELHVQDPDSRRQPKYKHRTRTIVTLIAVFALCWLPFAFIIIVQVFSSTHVPRTIDFASLILGYLNSFFNVIVYNITNRRIRQEYKNLYVTIIGKAAHWQQCWFIEAKHVTEWNNYRHYLLVPSIWYNYTPAHHMGSLSVPENR